MKSNVIKYLVFAIIIGGLMFFAYYMYQQNNKHTENQVVDTSKVELNKLNDFRLGIVNLDTLNPILSTNKNVQDISKLIFDPLLRITKDYKIENALASEYSKTGEHSYIVKLKQNITWQDGQPLTAEDVRFTVDRLKDTQSIYNSNVEHVVSVEVVDNYTIRLNLDKDVPFFEYYLTFPIMAKHQFENQDFKNTEQNQKPIGTGLYQISQVAGSYITLKQNTNWWEKQTEEIPIQTITLYLYSTMGEVYNAFKIGNIDLVSTNSISLEDYVGTIGYLKKEYPGREYDYLALNCEDDFLKREEVRKALSYCIDKNEIISNVYNNKYYSATFPLAYGNWLSNSENASEGYNVEQSKKILEEAGWSYKNNYWQKVENYKTKRIKLTLVVNQEQEARLQVAELLKKQIEESGIKVTISKVNDKQYQNYLEKKNYSMMLTGINIGQSPDLSRFFGKNNLANYTNEEMLLLIEEVKNISDERLLKEKYKRIEEIARQQMPYIGLYFNRNTVAYASNLMGEVTPNWYYLFYNIQTWYRQY